MTLEQLVALQTALFSGVDFSQLDFPLLQQMAITQPKIAGQHFTAFLKAGARMPLGDMKIATSPFDPETFIGKGWKLLAEEQDTMSAVVGELDLAKCDFAKCLIGNETRITGEVKLARLRDSKVVRYGAAVFMGLWVDYQAHKKESVLEKIYQSKGITYLDFFGDVLLDPDGGRYVLCLCRFDGGVWSWRYLWLDLDWRAYDQSLVSGQVS